jgi:hypothetical protein
MSQMNETDVLSLTAGGTITAFNRVKLDGSQQAVVAGAGEEAIGIALDDAVITDRIAVKVFKAGATVKVIASGAVTVGATLYAAASGKVTSTAQGPRIGVALAAASGNNSVIEMLWLPSAGDIATVGYTAIAADGVAGYYDFATGLAATPSWYQLLVYNGSTGAARVITTLVWTTGTARATVASLATGDKMMLSYRA